MSYRLPHKPILLMEIFPQLRFPPLDDSCLHQVENYETVFVNVLFLLRDTITSTTLITFNWGLLTVLEGYLSIIMAGSRVAFKQMWCWRSNTSRSQIHKQQKKETLVWLELLKPQSSSSVTHFPQQGHTSQLFLRVLLQLIHQLKCVPNSRRFLRRSIRDFACASQCGRWDENGHPYAGSVLSTHIFLFFSLAFFSSNPQLKSS